MPEDDTLSLVLTLPERKATWELPKTLQRFGGFDSIFPKVNPACGGCGCEHRHMDALLLHDGDGRFQELALAYSGFSLTFGNDAATLQQMIECQVEGVIAAIGHRCDWAAGPRLLMREMHGVDFFGRKPGVPTIAQLLPANVQLLVFPGRGPEACLHGRCQPSHFLVPGKFPGKHFDLPGPAREFIDDALADALDFKVAVFDGDLIAK
jgi:hypothetical protein